MKHKIEWRMTGTVEFDTDETDPASIRRDFINAVEGGFDFERAGDVDDFTVTDIDGDHIHDWVLSYFKDSEYCASGCHQRREVTP